MTARIARLAGQVLLPGFHGPVCPEWLADELAAGLGGVCLFGSNVESLGQLLHLTAELRSHGDNPVIAIDEEGGDVSRLYAALGSPAAGNAYLGRIDDIALTERTMAAIGSELVALGISMDLAPVADINSDPRNPVIGVRSFGADTELVSRHVAAAVRGLQGAGVGAVAKHFPGHGDTAVDSHVGIPVLDGTVPELRRRELRPFVAAIDAGTAAVMTAHLSVPALDPEWPASLSPATTALLRKELGFTGLIVTDALDMQGASGSRGIPEAAVQALVAGAQLLCIGTDNTQAQLGAIRTAIVDAVDSGRLSDVALEHAAAGVADFRSRFAGTPGAGPGVDYPPVGPAGLLVRTPLQPHRRPLIIRLHGSFNFAAGDVVWGIGAHLRSDPGFALENARFADLSDLAVLDALLGEETDEAVVVLGRNIGRSAFQSEAIARIRERAPRATVVEMGWPLEADSASPIWDVASFGAGRAVSLALAGLLGAGVPR